MAYYDDTDTVYFPAFDVGMVVSVCNLSTAPITPFSGVTWALTPVAGTGAGPISSELPPFGASFYHPVGLVPWPKYVGLGLWRPTCRDDRRWLRFFVMGVLFGL